MSVNIEDVKRWIRVNVSSIHSTEDVSNHWGCSTETLRKSFWRLEKITLGRFVLELKLEKAKMLLIRTNKLCKIICFESGFRREDTGAEIFKREVGLTMGQFRLAYGQNKSTVRKQKKN